MKTWRVSTLVKRALAQSDDSEMYWKCVCQLHLRGTEEVFNAAAGLCSKNKNSSRALGSDVLGQLGTPDRPFREPSLKLLWSTLESSKSPKVLNSALVAVGHLQEHTDTRRLGLLTKFAKHPNEAVRSGVVFALLSRSNQSSVRTLIRLSKDPAEDVRNWATFGLGTMIDDDTSKIRQALVHRFDDPSDETRCEALVGLARRKVTLLPIG